MCTVVITLIENHTGPSVSSKRNNTFFSRAASEQRPLCDCDHRRRFLCQHSRVYAQACQVTDGSRRVRRPILDPVRTAADSRRDRPTQATNGGARRPSKRTETIPSMNKPCTIVMSRPLRSIRSRLRRKQTSTSPRSGIAFPTVRRATIPMEHPWRQCLRRPFPPHHHEPTQAPMSQQ